MTYPPQVPAEPEPYPPAVPPATPPPAGVPPAPPPAGDVPVAPAGFDAKGRVRRTRVSGVWIGLVLLAVLLILLIIFIAQNTTEVAIHFLGFDGHISLGLALLIGVVVGLIAAAVPGTLRILQLRKALKANAADRGP